MPVDPFREATSIIDLQRALEHAQRQVSRYKARSDRLVEAVQEACRDAVVAQGPIRPVPRPRVHKGGRRPEVAVWHLTDWQGGKETRSYNSGVMRDRALEFVEVARNITDMRRSSAASPKLVIMFGGDMVEGAAFQFPTQPHEIDSTIFDQYVNVSRLLVDVVRLGLSFHDEVHVIGEWGNHGRIGSKRDAIPRSDNIDRMCYHLARSLLADEPRVTWPDCPEDIQRVQIGNYRALLIHSDEIGRLGFASPKTIVDWVTRQKSGAYPWRFRDVYGGHYHQHQEWSLPDGSGAFYMTGSMESENRYAGVMLAASAVPSQRLHFIDPDMGWVIATHKIWLGQKGKRK